MDQQQLNARKLLLQADHLAKGYDVLHPDLKKVGGVDWWRPTRKLANSMLTERFNGRANLEERIRKEMVPNIEHQELCFGANLNALQNLSAVGAWLSGQNFRLVSSQMNPTAISGRMEGNGPLAKYDVSFVFEKGNSKYLTILSTGRRVDHNSDGSKTIMKYPSTVFEALLLEANSLMRRAGFRPFFSPSVIDAFSGSVFFYSDGNRAEEAIKLLERTRRIFCNTPGFARPQPDLFEYKEPAELELDDLGI